MPVFKIWTVLLYIRALLSAPNLDEPLNNTVGSLWKSDEEEALKRASQQRILGNDEEHYEIQIRVELNIEEDHID
ncbi:hypothetical protein ACHAWO_002460 [Cyclotella atomus]|uniref:UBC core domain-containing protein n=1 Tax=Cyclotella atomus TaxID=382360 RepID=A0ABD3NKL3_9STRA